MMERTKPIRGKRTRRPKPKQTRFTFPNGWGGRRAGSGRKPQGKSAGVAHRTRTAFTSRRPVEVTLSLRAGLPSLRGLREFAVLRGALAAGCERGEFRLIHFSVQSNHLHFIAEGDDRNCLARGLQGLAIRMARALNRLWHRCGSVFADRYHDRILGSPREVWFALRYVLCNARKHGAWTSSTRHDPFSSAPWFNGWRETLPAPEAASPTALARTWLLRKGWRALGLMSLADAPARAQQEGPLPMSRSPARPRR